MLSSRGMNICLIGPKESKASLAIKHAADSRGHYCRRFYMKDFYFEIVNGKLTAGHRKEDINNFDVFIFRNLNSEYYEAIQLASCLKDLGKKIIDERLAECPNIMDQYIRLGEAGVPQVNRTRTNGLKSARDILMDFNHPALVKPLNETSKSYTFSDDWTDSYDIVRTEKSKKFEFQELPEVQSFYNAIVIGNEVLGVVKKTAKENDLRLNFASKFSYEKVDNANEVSQIALRAHKAVGYEITMIDIVDVEGELKVLEVTRAPKFLKFQSVTGVNVAEKIVDFIESRA